MSKPAAATVNPAAPGTADDGTPLDRPSTDPNAIGANDQPSARSVVNEAAIESASREALIRQAAHRRYLERGDGPGSEEQDWLEAEAEIERSRTGQ